MQGCVIFSSLKVYRVKGLHIKEVGASDKCSTFTQGMRVFEQWNQWYMLTYYDLHPYTNLTCTSLPKFLLLQSIQVVFKRKLNSRPCDKEGHMAKSCHAMKFKLLKINCRL